MVKPALRIPKPFIDLIFLITGESVAFLFNSLIERSNETLELMLEQ